MTRRLKDALAKAAGVQITEEPVVIKVTAVDKVATLEAVAKQGIEAITALTVERNEAVALVANVNQKLNVVQALNVDLREREAFWRSQAYRLMEVNAKLQALMSNASGTWQLMHQEVHRANAEIAQMQPLIPADNNPTLPDVDVMGLPVDLEQADEEPQGNFDKNGVPANQAVSVGNERIKEMIERLEAIQ